MSVVAEIVVTYIDMMHSTHSISQSNATFKTSASTVTNRVLQVPQYVQKQLKVFYWGNFVEKPSKNLFRQI